MAKIDSYVVNYVTTNRFYVEMGGCIVACFSEFSGVRVQIQKNTYFEGGVNDEQRITLGHVEFADVTLKRGITDDSTFSQWLGQIFEYKNTRRHVSILLFNQAGELMKSWTLLGSIPIAWKTSPLQADGNCVAIEELTLAFEGLKIGKNPAGGESALRKCGSFGSSIWAPKINTD